MGRYNTLEEAGYTDIVRTETLTSWDSALKRTQRGAEIITKPVYHAKRDGKCFRVVLEHHYRNRSSELGHTRIGSVTEVTLDEYDAAKVKIGDNYMPQRV